MIVTGCRKAQVKPTPSPSAPSALKIAPPAGWVQRTNDAGEIVLTTKDADVGANFPSGPRLVVRSAASLPAVSRLRQIALGVTTPDSGTVFEEPFETKVGGAAAVAIALKEGDGGRWWIRRYVTANTGDARIYSFVLEAPEDQWEKS